MDEQKLNRALEALYFGFRALTAYPDSCLEKLGLSRVHHRILYFIGRHPDSSVNALLKIMRVSKQYLNRPLRHLVNSGYVQVTRDSHDRRVKRLRLTKEGEALERMLTGAQRQRLEEVFKEVGAQAEAGWLEVMKRLSDSESESKI